MFSPWSERQLRTGLGLAVGGGLLVALYLLATGTLLFAADRSRPLTILLPLALALPGYALAVATLPWPWALAVGLALRLAAVFAFPTLSDDVYRFLWDGELWWAGLHPLDFVPNGAPSAFAKTHDALLAPMNSAGYFTVYPPLSQAVFAAATALTDDVYWATALLKGVLFAGEACTLALLARLRVAARPVAARAYALHPLVIVEVVGNAHFEGLALLAILGVVYALRRGGLGLARQGWYHLRDGWTGYRLSQAQLFGAAPRPRIRPGPPTLLYRDSSASTAPGIPDGLAARVPGLSRERKLWWVAMAGLLLGAAALVKLVPLVLAPACALAVLWARAGRWICSAAYYRRLTDEQRAALGDAAALPPHFVAPTWPAELIAPAPVSLEEVRTWDLRPGMLLPPRAPRREWLARAWADARARWLPLVLRPGTRRALPELPGPRRWDWAGAATLTAATCATLVVGFAVFLAGSDVTGFGESLGLYFRRFEFNGSAYTLGRAWGEWYKGYNWIARVGPSLAVAGALGIVTVSVLRAWRAIDLAETLLWCLGLYLLCATTVHAWYFIPLIGLAALTRYRWPYLLGFTASLSYLAYTQVPVEVPSWALWCEYVPVIALALWELRYPREWR